MSPLYEAQVDLLLRVTPAVASEACFGLKGGTAINLFLRDMPRLSVDLDLTYLPLEPRADALARVAEALDRVATRLQPLGIQAVMQREACKLIARTADAVVKVEVSRMMRGTLYLVRERVLCPAAQERFARFVAMPVVHKAEVFAGKLVAALDRQHPRDLFDTRFIHDRIDREGVTEELRVAFLAGLLSSSRPPEELLRSWAKDPASAFRRAFTGMAREPFTPEDHARVFTSLGEALPRLLGPEERGLLFGFVCLEGVGLPGRTADLSGVRWKRLNLEKLRAKDCGGWEQAVNVLSDALEDGGFSGRLSPVEPGGPG